MRKWISRLELYNNIMVVSYYQIFCNDELRINCFMYFIFLAPGFNFILIYLRHNFHKYFGFNPIVQNILRELI